MATRGIAAALLTLLTLAALPMPLAAGQFGGTDPSTAPPNAIVVSTGELTYTVGQPVLFTLRNNASQPLNVSGWKLHLTVQGGGQVDLPLNASLNGSLALQTDLAPGSALNLTWDTARAIAGSYTGFLERSDGWVLAVIDNGASWMLQATAFASVRLDAPGLVPAGQSVVFTLTNQGPGVLTGSACGPRLTVRNGQTRQVVHDSAVAQPCADEGEQTLQAGDARSITWDLRGDDGQPVAAGPYLVRAEFGGRASDAALRIQGDLPTGSRALSLRAPAETRAGAAVHLLLVNNGTLDLHGQLSMDVHDAQARAVYARGDNVTLTLPASGSFEMLWDTRSADGQLVGDGVYSIHIGFAGLDATSAVRVTGPAGNSTGPHDARTPLDVTGTHVSVRVGDDALHLRIGGSDVLTLGAGGWSPLADDAGLVRLRSPAGDVTVFDNAAPSVRVELPPNALQGSVRFAAGIQVSVGDGQATFDGPQVHGILVAYGEARVAQGEPGTNEVVVRGDPAARGMVGFVVRITPGPVAAPAAKAEPALPQAIADSRVAAEAFIAPGAQLSVVPYVNAASVHVVGASAHAIDLRVDVDEHQARVLVFHLGAGVLAGDARDVQVLFDGQTIQPADNVTDVLDPDDDGLRAEYVVVAAGQGLDVLISVPHFSPHDIRIQSGVAEVVQNLGPYGIAAGFVMALVAGGVMLRRRP